ncbi:MAG: ASKHA domain-containing protein, partial [Oscillospiraceae bacterium]|nr:ASKHA domain-containing protein [Oscillospiraceae bacterium]
HFFDGLDPRGIGVAPFVPKSLFGAVTKIEDTFVDSTVTAPIYLAPCIGPYIGGDISCGIVFTGLAGQGRTALLIDVGTNGEIALSKRGEITCCSTAAGPAFEGGEIAMGMVASSGAVDFVWFDGTDIKYTTVDGTKPVGICGTGIISAVGALLKAGVIDETGRILSCGHGFEDRLTSAGDTPAVFVAERDIFLSQKDIRNIQLAKAAVAAGIDTLLHETGTSAAEIERLHLCGGFGSGIRVASAAAIGLFPAELVPVAVSTGNSALAGAAMLLFSKENRAAIEKIAGEAKELPLSSSPYFMERYIERMSF